jgi:hypothetical protein
VPIYRFYTITQDGHIGGPAKQHDLPDDVAALGKARQVLADQDIEIWLGSRVVGYLTAQEEEPAAAPLRATSRL